MSSRSSRPRGRPRREPRGDQRARILGAARTLFARDGYDATTLSGVARVARVSRADIYDLVGGKEQLLGAVVDAVAAELIRAADERFSGRAESEPLLEGVLREETTWFVRTIAADPTVSAIVRLSGRLSGRSPDPGAQARAALEERIARLHDARARTLGQERPTSARVLATMVLGAVEGVIRRLPADDWDPDAVATLVAEFVVGGYLRAELGGGAERFEREH